MNVAPYTDAVARGMSENQWQDVVLELARNSGWWVYHPHDSRRSEAGWPDLTLVRSGVMLFIELKTMTGRVSTEQKRVHALLAACGMTPLVARPSDLERVAELLRRRR